MQWNPCRPNNGDNRFSPVGTMDIRQAVECNGTPAEKSDKRKHQSRRDDSPVSRRRQSPPNVTSLLHQILHREASMLPDEELRCGNCAQSEALAAESLMRKHDAVGGRLGSHAVDAVHLALAGHINK